MSRRSPRRRRTSWYSSVATVPHVEAPHVDARGWLQVTTSAEQFNHPIGAIIVFRSIAGTERANHYHKRDAHWCHLLSGSMEYFERGKDGSIQRWIIKAGEAVFTPPGVEHTMRFLEDTLIVGAANRHRTQKDYEKDLIRVPSLAQEWDERQVEKFTAGADE